MRISDWSSDVCSSDLIQRRPRTFCRPRCDGLPQLPAGSRPAVRRRDGQVLEYADLQAYPRTGRPGVNAARQRTWPLPRCRRSGRHGTLQLQDGDRTDGFDFDYLWRRSEEHTSELQSLMRISYAVFCLKTKKNT